MKIFSATRAILDALIRGRKLSQMDCREFEVEDMRTVVSHLKKKFDEYGFVLHSKWIETPKGRRIKEYWLIKSA